MADRPALDPALAALIERTWPGFAPRVLRAGALGFSWSAVSTAFVRRDGERAVAHVGVVDVPLVIAGRRRSVAAIHAVCTDPGARGRGHCRALLEEALAFCDARYETVVLTTLIPTLYEKFGFRRVSEHVFSRPLPPGARPRAGARPLDLDATEDVRRLRRLLERRTPVSERLGVLERGEIFGIATQLWQPAPWRLHYVEPLDVVTVHAVVDGALHLWDVVGETIPRLPVLLEYVGDGADSVVTYFTPDRLADGFEAQPWEPITGEDGLAGLMARGRFEVEAQPFMMPPMART